MYNNILDGFMTESEYNEMYRIINTFKIKKEFSSTHFLSEGEAKYLKKSLDIIEFALINSWDDDILINNLATMYNTYIDVAKLVPFPDDDLKRIKYLLKFISYGYLGESWESIKRFIFNDKNRFEIDIQDNVWSRRLLKTIYMSIFYLLKKNSWKDLENSIDMINKLKEEQSKFEKEYLNTYNEIEVKSASYELAALYHLAKAVEYVGEYQLYGSPDNVNSTINNHFKNSITYTEAGNIIDLNIVLRCMLPAFQKMINNSIWSLAQNGSNAKGVFIKKLIRSSSPIIEFLYPQRYSLVDKDLLNPAHKAIVINLPTSSGKTLISEFKMLQALNQFSEEKGWIAYIAPTRALVNQVTIQLKRDLGDAPLNIKIEKMSGALEIDSYEENMMKETYDLDILVTTPEKLSLLIRQGIEEKIGRKLILVIVDEAQNISADKRGINLETLLSMIKNDCEYANYLLMSPFIPNPNDLAVWLDNENPKDISVNLHFWRPNDMIVGIHYGEGRRNNYNIKFQPLIINKNKVNLKEDINIKMDRNIKKIELTTKYKLTSLLASKLKHHENILILSGTKNGTFSIADYLYPKIDYIKLDEEITLIKTYIAQELGEEFPLVKYLDKGIAIHHAGLPDDIRYLIEYLMDNNKIKYLISTTTTAQGMNFPVSTILVAQYSYPYKAHMPSSDFWNLAGRVGRVYTDSPGIVSIAVKGDVNSDDGIKAMKFINLETKALISNLVNMVEDALDRYSEINLESLYHIPQWSTFLQYLSHMFKQTNDLDEYILQIEDTLKQTYGYNQLNEENKRVLINSVVVYAEKLTQEAAILSDKTGFSSVTINSISPQIKEANIIKSDFTSKKLFEPDSEPLRNLVGIMLQTPEINESLKKIKITGNEVRYNTVARLITDWVLGKDIPTISKNIFGNSNYKTIAECVLSIYSRLTLSASWGLSSFQKMLSDSLEFENLSEFDQMRLQNIPAMIYYGVNTDEAILLRKASVPRSISMNLGEILQESLGEQIFYQTASQILDWLYDLPEQTWDKAAPYPSIFSGTNYKNVWKILVGRK